MPNRNLLYISPQFPPNYVPFVYSLHRYGVRVFGIGTDYYDVLSSELKTALTDYYRVDDVNDYQQYLAAARYFEQRYGAIDRIESHSEFYLPIEGALREDLGVLGKKRMEVCVVRQRSMLKDFFRQAGVDVARSVLTNQLDQAEAFAALVGYPLIAKLDESEDTFQSYKISTLEELKRLLSVPNMPRYLFEEFVDGDVLTFDGLTNNQGEIVYSNSLVYGRPVMDVVNDDDNFFYYTSRNLPQDLIDAGTRTVQAFDVREKFFHVEFIRRRKDQKLLGLHVKFRPPVGLTTDMWNYADDIDLYFEWARIIAQGNFEARWERKQHVLYVGRKDRFTYRYPLERIVQMHQPLLIHYTRMPTIYRNILGDTGVLFRSTKLDELLQAAKNTLAVEG